MSVGSKWVGVLCLGEMLGATLGGAVHAFPLDFPGNARLEREVVTPVASYPLPTGPFDQGYLPTLDLSGELTEQAWRIDAAALTTLQMLTPLRAQLVADGYDILFDCDTDDCGGFDFRVATVILPPPEMFVDLGDFRFLAATRGEEALSLLVSRTSAAGFVQVIRIGPPATGETVTGGTAPPMRGVTPNPPSADGTPMPGDFAAALETQGRVVLSDLAFATGSAQLAPGDFASLQRLADYLAANPTRRVALVGHTDSEGSLEANIALSKRRAGSVMERLVTDYGVPRQQIEAEGMGYLSPLATNLTEAGREANRRVEVIVISTE